jgi:hypothetical protein
VNEPRRRVFERPTLLAQCGDKGIKKITFGDDAATDSCVNGPNLAAAITKQITPELRGGNRGQQHRRSAVL